MLKYPCLVLDHDDTVVASEVAVNYPCFLLALKKFRPEEPPMDYPEFVQWCFRMDFADFLKTRYGFTDEEAREEYQMWLEYAKEHIPPACGGMKEIILEQKRRGGLVCVVSLSSRETILRDYRFHFGVEPDLIFSRDDPREQQKPNAYPLEQIMSRYQLQPQELLMVDDLKTGYEMARKAGVPSAFAGWCRRMVPEVGQQMKAWCDYAFDTVEELQKFLFPPAQSP